MLHLFQCFQRLRTISFIYVNDHIADFFIGLQVLTGNVDAVFRQHAVDLREHTQPAIETYRDRLEEQGISWGAIGAGVALVALGGAATYFSGGLGAALGQQAARQGAGMVLGGLGVGAAAAW